MIWECSAECYTLVILYIIPISMSSLFAHYYTSLNAALLDRTLGEALLILSISSGPLVNTTHL